MHMISIDLTDANMPMAKIAMKAIRIMASRSVRLDVPDQDTAGNVDG